MTPGEAAAWVGVVVTLGIAIVSWRHANRADHRSTEALRLATQAEARADRLEAAAHERRDVEWECNIDRDAHGVWMTNIGTTTAYDVEVVIDRPTYGRTSATNHEVPPTQSVFVQGLPEREVTLMSFGSKFSPHHSPTSMQPVPGRARITWRSNAGFPGISQHEVG